MKIKHLYLLKVLFLLMSFLNLLVVCLQALIQGAIDVYKSVSLRLKPIPSCAHYQFSLHDLHCVFEGLMLLSPKMRRKKQKGKSQASTTPRSFFSSMFFNIFLSYRMDLSFKFDGFFCIFFLNELSFICQFVLKQLV